MESANLIRLNKFLADSGLASRRKADGLILSGVVQVNGKTVYELGVRVDPQVDRITVNGKPVKPPSLKLYVVFNKPENVLTSMSDPEGRPTVADYMAQLPVRVFPVGRLDWDTEGLLILTNDGEFAQQVMHPKHEIPKTYLAKLDGQPSKEQLDKLLRGVTIPGGRVSAIHIERARVGHSDQYDWVKIVIGEGKNRQVRHMFKKIGFDVKKLRRVAIGQLTLGPLQKGEFAFIDEGGLRKVFAVRRDADVAAARPHASKKTAAKPKPKANPKSKRSPARRHASDRTERRPESSRTPSRAGRG